MKKSLIFLGGLVSGFGLCLGLEELKKRKDNEVLEVIQYDRKEDTNEEKPTERSQFEKPELDQLVKKYRTDESKYKDYNINKVEEDNHYPPEDYLAPEEDEPEEEEDNDESPEVEFSFPQIIPRIEFENEKKNYEVQTLMYYAYDDTVCDENEQVISSPEDLIGDDALVCFGLGSDDPNTVYICNDKRGTKYEVIKVDSSYLESVLGEKWEPGVIHVTKTKRREDVDTD